MQLLKQSTAATTVVGPILDSAGAEYTGAVIADMTITKNGTSAAMAAAATLTHLANGHYTLVFTTGNTDTLGRVDVHCNKSTYQMPPIHFDVLPATVYDALVTNAVNATGGLVGATGAVTGVSGVLATTTNITAGTITTTTNVTTVNGLAANVITAAATAADFGAEIATAFWTDTTASDFTTVLSIGKSIMNGVTLGTGLTINGYTGNTVQTGDSFARIGAAGVGLTAVALADATSDAIIADAIWNAATASYGSAGSYGLLVETDLDATISSRMATYAQPTGFLAATFPGGTIANTTNITAGTITTVTNLTNAPTAGDLTATMKASVNTEVDAAIETYHLDHLIAVADPGAIVANSSLWAALTSKSATPAYSSYVNTTDSLEALRDNTGTAGAGLTNIGTIATVTTLTNKTGFSLAATGLDLVTAWTTDITGSLSGSVGSVTGAVGSVTGAVGSVATGGITAASIAANAIGASELAADAVAEIADAVWDELLSGHVISGSSGEALAAANAPTAAAIATAVWQDATAGDFTTASSIGKALYIANVAPGGSGGLLISGSNAGTTTLGELTVTGATTLTGAVTATNGTNVISGLELGPISTPVVVSGQVLAFGSDYFTFTGGSTYGTKLIGQTVKIYSGTGIHQTRTISSYNALNFRFGVDQGGWGTVPAAADKFAVFAASGPALDSSLKITGVVLTDTTTTLTNLPAAAALEATLTTIASYIDTEVAAIKAKTDQLAFTNAGKVDASLLAVADLALAVANKIADHVRRRTQANVEASTNGDALSMESQYGAIQMQQESSIAGTVITVYKTDGTTILGTRTAVLDAAALPIKAVS